MVATNGNGRLRSTEGEIASVDRDYGAGFNAYRRYFLKSEDQGILAKGKGKKLAEIYRDVEKDAKVTEGLSQRYGAVLARETVVEPASPSRLDKKVADEVRSQINSLNRRRNAQVLNTKGAIYSFGGFDHMSLGMLDATFMGYGVGEIDWVSDSDRTYVRQIWNRDQSRFIFNVVDGGYELRLLTSDSPFDGVQLPARKFLVHSIGSKTGNPYGEGLAERLFWWVWFKRQELKFWLTFSDKYGSPTLKGTYDNERQRDRLLEIMGNVAQQAGIALPRGVELDLLAAATSHTTTYQDLCTYCDGQMTAAILLQNLTTNVQGGSYAAAETHFEVRSELTDADCSALSTGPYNDLATWITEYNFGIDATPPLVYKPRVRTPDEARARRDQILVGLVGRPLSDNYLKTFYDAEFKTPEEVAKEQATASAIATLPQEEAPFAFTETVDFKTATPTKQRTCSKGFACGGSCIAKGKKCNNKLDGAAVKAADYLDAKVPKVTSKAKATAKTTKTKETPQKAESTPKAATNKVAETTPDERKQFMKDRPGSKGRLAGAKKAMKKIPGAPPPHPEELVALEEYTSLYYGAINAALRGNDKDVLSKPLTTQQKAKFLEDARFATAALDALPNHTGTVYRGTVMPKSLLDQYEVGKTITEKAFVSTSTEPNVAESFGKGAAGGEVSVRYAIQSKQGKSVKMVSAVPGEEEILFKPDTQFKVLGKKTKNGVVHIYLEEN